MAHTLFAVVVEGGLRTSQWLAIAGLALWAAVAVAVLLKWRAGRIAPVQAKVELAGYVPLLFVTLAVLVRNEGMLLYTLIGLGLASLAGAFVYRRRAGSTGARGPSHHGAPAHAGHGSRSGHGKPARGRRSK